MEEEDEPVSRSPTEREAGGVQWQRRAVWLTPTPTPTLPLPVLVRCLVGILRLRRWLIWAGGRGGISRRKQPPRQGANASEMVLHSPSLSPRAGVSELVAAAPDGLAPVGCAVDYHRGIVLARSGSILLASSMALPLVTEKR
jgi:hypothetical protein